MRRRDREMDRNFALEIIDEAPFGVLSLQGETTAYGLPLSLVRDDDSLYFHSAREGHKFDLIQEGTPVHVVFVSRVKVPDLYSDAELGQIAASPGGIAQLTSQVFTTEFASAMVEGILQEVLDPDDKKKALERICLKYTPDRMAYFEKAIAAGAELTRVFAIHMESVTAKRKKFGPDRRELKFGRME